MAARMARARVIRADRSTRTKTKSISGRARYRRAGYRRAEEDDLHPLAHRHNRVRRHHREAVGTHHGAEDARALIAGEPRAILPAVPRERHPQVATPAAGVPNRLEHPRPDAWPVDRERSEERRVGKGGRR